ncbi:phage tail tape measure protein [Mycolicibacterium moriokaense]|nr:phage tail tape measure protein [Mycolicibacterium moriokaense]
MAETEGGRVIWILDVDDSKLTAGVARAKGEVNSIGTTANKASGSFASSFKSMIKYGLAFGGLAVTFDLVRTSLTAVVGGAATFEQSLNVLKSVTDATGSQMALLQGKARDLGNDLTLPGVSAADAAGAMTELAKAGLGVNDILGASKGVLSLAKAGQLDVADAATIAARALNTFGLSGDKAGTVADLLAAGANASTASVQDMAYALAQGGAGAKQFGISVNDTVTALALFSNAGINGSDAGTSLKTMLQRLAAPASDAAAEMKRLGLTFFNSKGEFVGLSSASGQLQKALSTLTVEQRNAALATIFGSDSSRVAAILADQGAAGFDKMAAAVNRQGAAADLAKAQNSGFLGALDGLQSTLETIATDIGLKVLPALTDIVKGTSNALPGLVSTVEDTFNRIAAGGTQFINDVGKGNFESVGKVIGSGIAGGIKTGIKGLTIGLDAIKNFFGSVNYVEVGEFIVTKIIPGIAIGLIAGLGKLDIVNDILKPLGDNIGPVLLGILSIALAPAKLLGPLSKVLTKLPFGDAFLGVIKVLRDSFAPIRNAFAGLFKGAVDGAGGILRNIVLLSKGVIDSVIAFFGGIGPNVGLSMRVAFDFAVKGVADVIATLPQLIRAVFNIIVGDIRASIDPIFGAFRSVFGGVVNFVSGLVSPIAGRIGNAIIDSIITVRNFIGRFFDIGRQLVQGLINGIVSGIGSLLNAVRNMAGSAVNEIKKKLGIHSPSTVFAEIGSNITAGLVDGIKGGAADVEKAIGGLSTDLTTTVGTNSVSGSQSASASSQQPIVVNFNPSGIVARSRSEWRDIMKDGVEAINEELRARRLPQLGNGSIAGRSTAA